MGYDYEIEYVTRNTYEKGLNEAFWQFLIIPENNDTQELISWNFENDLGMVNSVSINGLGFKTVQVRAKEQTDHINFRASFKLSKKEINPYDFPLPESVEHERALLHSHNYRVDHEPFLRKTKLTQLSAKYENLFLFNNKKSIFENLVALNKWVFEKLIFQSGVTDVGTQLSEIIENRHGVCQDFSHLFCAIAKQNGVPSRYVSGYLHQGNGFFGDSQMHAWAESHIPNVGWIGFDPTNNILANHNHIKVSHGKDYNDCAPLKGVVYTLGKNKTQYSVQVKASQQQ
ncbi:transglutaminase family protein [Muricauda sp. JGD-17]|uniref:Transglutaminase family protein n=1 Tax=Flagellimonas ochracea TaxID=2696472 RepID=A0A964TA93_9FLAO|nr:transglutaminase family protein [Allomuricauda ochracea]NAY91123.1 transglutaminase family protein [Allomuricauda ochracea]